MHVFCFVLVCVAQCPRALTLARIRHLPPCVAVPSTVCLRAEDIAPARAAEGASAQRRRGGHPRFRAQSCSGTPLFRRQGIPKFFLFKVWRNVERLCFVAPKCSGHSFAQHNGVPDSHDSSRGGKSGTSGTRSRSTEILPDTFAASKRECVPARPCFVAQLCIRHPCFAARRHVGHLCIAAVRHVGHPCFVAQRCAGYFRARDKILPDTFAYNTEARRVSLLRSAKVCRTPSLPGIKTCQTPLPHSKELRRIPPPRSTESCPAPLLHCLRPSRRRHWNDQHNHHDGASQISRAQWGRR